jgi:ferredoxin
MRAAFAAKSWTVSRCAQWIVSTRVRTCSIHPDECIDCGVCVPECPVDAIKPDTDPGLEEWLLLNAKYAKIWPNITVKKAPPTDSKEWEGKPDKLQYFSPNPGAGD